MMSRPKGRGFETVVTKGEGGRNIMMSQES